MNEQRVYDRDGKTFGLVRGNGRPCRQVEGCLGTQLCVRWPDGKRTWPCTKGMFVRPDGHYQIQ
jgi:hypothetical protein